MDIELKLKDKCNVLYLATFGLDDPSVKYYKLSAKIEPVYDDVIDHSASIISVPPFPAIYLCTEGSCSHRCFLNQLDLDNHIAVEHISKRVKRKSNNAKDDPTNDAFVTATSEYREDPQSKVGVGANNNKPQAISLDVDSGTETEVLSSSNSNTTTTTSSSSSNAALPVPTQTDNIGGQISSKNLAEINLPFVKPQPQEKLQKNLTFSVDCTCNQCFDNVKDFILHIDLDHEIQRGLHFDFLPFPTCKMCSISKQRSTDFEDDPTSFAKHLRICHTRIKQSKTLFKPKSHPSIPVGSNVDNSNKWYGQFIVDATQQMSLITGESSIIPNRRTTRSASVARNITTIQKNVFNLAARSVGPAGPEIVTSGGNTNSVQPEGKQTTRVSSPSPPRQVRPGRSRREGFDRYQQAPQHQGIKGLQGCQPLPNPNRQQPNKRAFAFRSPSRTESRTRKKAKTGQNVVGDKITHPEIQQVEAVSQNCIKHSQRSRNSLPEPLEPDLTLIQLEEGKEVHIHTPPIDPGSSFGSFGVTHETYRQLSSTPIVKPTRNKK